MADKINPEIVAAVAKAIRTAIMRQGWQPVDFAAIARAAIRAHHKSENF